MQLKMLFDPHQKCQAMQSTKRFYVYMTNDVEIVVWTHSSEKADVDQNLNASGKKLLQPLTCDLWSTPKSLKLRGKVVPTTNITTTLVLTLSIDCGSWKRESGKAFIWEMWPQVLSPGSPPSPLSFSLSLALSLFLQPWCNNPLWLTGLKAPTN